MTNAVNSHLITSYERTPEKKKEDASLGLALFGLILMFPASAWYAFVVWKLYGWFVVPLGFPVVNWWHMWGLLLIFNLIIISLKPSRNDQSIAVTVRKMVFQPFTFGITLLLGWLISGMI